MKLKAFKTLNYENLKIDAKKCLSPVLKKLSNQKIKSNIEKIKSTFHSYDQTLLNTKLQNNELEKDNNIFKKHLNKYFSYKNFLDKKQKHKTKKNNLNELEKLKLKYYKKGYKIPNLVKNIFTLSPLNYEGVPIRKYFNELYKKEKKEITLKEKNLDFLIRLDKNIKDIKIKENIENKDKNKNKIKSVNISPIKRFSVYKQKFKNSNSKLIVKSINFEEKKELSPEKLKSIKNEDKNNNNNNNIDMNIDYYNKLFEEDEEFKELNEYEKKCFLKLIQDNENVKKYNKYINKILKDKTYFDIIDNKNFESNGKHMNKNNYNKNLNKTESIHIKSSKPRHNYKKNKLNNMDNSEESSISSEKPDLSSNQTIDLLIKNQKNNNPNTNTIFNNNNKNQNSRNFKLYPKLKKSLTIKNFIDLNNIAVNNNNKIINKQTRQIISHPTNINKIKNNKRLSFSIKPETVSHFLGTINEDDKTNKNNNNLFKNNNNLKNFQINNLKKSSFLKYKDFNNYYNNYNYNFNDYIKNEKFLTKEDSLNYLFKRIKSEKKLDDEFINEYKKYFIKNKNISEYTINKFINRKYDINDFVNLCVSIDKKVKEGNIMNKWKKNYLRIGKLDEIKYLLREEVKQDHFISHLLQNYMNSMDGKRNYYDYESNDLDLID